MSEIVLFHHIRGLTPGVLALAEAMRKSGHTVHTPDLYDGQIFPTIEAGAALAESVGTVALAAQTRAAVDGLPSDIAYVGISMGGLFAELLALTRPGARGAILLESCVPPGVYGQFGYPDLVWPEDLPVQIHGMDNDPFFAGEGDIDVARELVGAGGDRELFVYPGDQHLFCDASLESYDPEATDLMLGRVRDFLDRL
jgi:dienelactone hydrolase